jgi:hypothetical protein
MDLHRPVGDCCAQDREGIVAEPRQELRRSNEAVREEEKESGLNGT